MSVSRSLTLKYHWDRGLQMRAQTSVKANSEGNPRHNNNKTKLRVRGSHVF